MHVQLSRELSNGIETTQTRENLRALNTASVPLSSASRDYIVTSATIIVDSPGLQEVWRWASLMASLHRFIGFMWSRTLALLSRRSCGAGVQSSCLRRSCVEQEVQSVLTEVH